MPIWLAILLLVLGFVMLVKGADWFVDGAAGLAEKIRIPQLVIGLTVVAFGTSAPELAVSLTSNFDSSEGLAIGNVIGSNITNICLILGLSAIFTALPADKDLRKIDLPVLLFVSAIFIVFAYTGGVIERWEGILMAALLVAYTVFLIVHALKHRAEETQETDAEEEEPQKGFAAWYEAMKEKVWFLAVILVVGLALVIWGADISVTAATAIAQELKIPEEIIGLTVIAIGTSLPELVTSVTAAIKGKTDIAVGNIVGSNIFNVLMVAGLSSAILPLSVDSAFYVSAFIALGAAVILSALCYWKGNKVTRWGGVVLLCCFVAYYAYLFLA